MNRCSLHRRQSGIALILVTIGALALLGMAGLALDMGMAYIAKSRLQNAVDAAALDGAKVLNDTGSVSAATTAALATFGTNMGGTSATATVQTSPTLQPFSAGAANPRFVRVSVGALPVAVRLARVLPGVGDSLDIGASAVAGPIPLGDTVCDALPVALCGTPGDTDCTDGSCFGFAAGTTDELELKGDNVSLTHGNYGLVELSCGTGAACVRDGLAGGHEVCFSQSGTITTEPGVKAGPTRQGLDTRFGIYNGPVSAAEYPPDVVTTYSPVIFHSTYEARLTSPASWNYTSPPGRPQRRVTVIPVIDCSVPITGRSEVPLIGGACLFLTRPVSTSGGSIYGQLVPTCEAAGAVAEDPDPDSAYYRIILYRDASSTQS
ncbi:MAG: TadE/TadG family type IV pilus assembly protein [Pseudomonadota bacterium]